MEVDEYTEIGLGRQGPNGLMTGQIYPWLFLTNFGGLLLLLSSKPSGIGFVSENSTG